MSETALVADVNGEAEAEAAKVAEARRCVQEQVGHLKHQLAIGRGAVALCFGQVGQASEQLPELDRANSARCAATARGVGEELRGVQGLQEQVSLGVHHPDRTAPERRAHFA